MRKFILQQDCNWLSKFFWQNMKYIIFMFFFIYNIVERHLTHYIQMTPNTFQLNCRTHFQLCLKKTFLLWKKHCSLHSTFVQLKCSMYQVSNTAGHQDQGVYKITIWSLQKQRFYCFDNIHCLSLEKEAKKSIGIRSLAQQIQFVIYKWMYYITLF